MPGRATDASVWPRGSAVKPRGRADGAEPRPALAWLCVLSVRGSFDPGEPIDAARVHASGLGSDRPRREVKQRRALAMRVTLGIAYPEAAVGSLRDGSSAVAAVASRRRVESCGAMESPIPWTVSTGQHAIVKEQGWAIRQKRYRLTHVPDPSTTSPPNTVPLTTSVDSAGGCAGNNVRPTSSIEPGVRSST